MAILKGLEGQAHVESKSDLSNWSGHIVLAANLADIGDFDIVGPAAKGVYEGPAMIEGNYYFVNGNVLIRKVDFLPSDPTELRVEFIGDGKINIVRSLSIVPDDYLP